MRDTFSAYRRESFSYGRHGTKLCPCDLALLVRAAEIVQLERMRKWRGLTVSVRYIDGQQLCLSLYGSYSLRVLSSHKTRHPRQLPSWPSRRAKTASRSKIRWS